MVCGCTHPSEAEAVGCCGMSSARAVEHTLSPRPSQHTEGQWYTKEQRSQKQGVGAHAWDKHGRLTPQSTLILPISKEAFITAEKTTKNKLKCFFQKVQKVKALATSLKT